MKILEKIKENNFILLGRAGIDIYPDPPGTKTEEANKFFTCLGGSAANIAVSIVKLGGKASIITSVSDDALGRLALNQLKKYKVDISNVSLTGGESRLSLAVVESRIEDHQSIIYRNGAADLKLSIENINFLDFSNYGCLIVTGTALALEPSRSATFKAFELAQNSNIPIVLDIDYRPYTWTSKKDASSTYSKAAKYCDIIIGNDLEFDIMAGYKDEGLKFAKSLIKMNSTIVIFKMGEHGSITFTENNFFKTGIFSVNPIKPTGAGDAFMGAFVKSLATGNTIENSVKYGSASAAIVVTRVGCSPAMPTLKELENFLQNNLIKKPSEVLENAYSTI